MRKWMMGATAALAGVGLLAGCSNGSDAGGGDVTLTYGVWSQDETMQELIDTFEADNPALPGSW
ncbi:MAG: hypothetical protein ACTHX2_06120 [Microbacterium sp.]